MINKYIVHIIILCLSSAVLPHCGSKQPEETFAYTPLGKFTVDSAAIRAHDEVRILGFSGGPQNSKDTAYYAQFLVITKLTGDTVVILAPLIVYIRSAAPGDRVYTPATTFDGGKQIYDARFARLDSVPTEIVDGVENSASSRKKFVVIDKSIPNFDDHHYKNVVGILSFDQQPW
jgi:hypothetical protein